MNDPKRPQEQPHERVERVLRAKLDSGEWEPGEALPSLVALATMLNANRQTVGRVIKKLADEGQVTTRPRWGTFKAKPPDVTQPTEEPEEPGQDTDESAH